MEEVKFDYDMENDSLFLYRPNQAVKGSVEIGDFIIDLNSNLTKVVSLEIMNASKVLSAQLSKKINKSVLKNIKNVVLRTQHRDNALYVGYGISSIINNKQIREETFMPLLISRHH